MLKLYKLRLSSCPSQVGGYPDIFVAAPSIEVAKEMALKHTIVNRVIVGVIEEIEETFLSYSEDYNKHVLMT